MSDQEKGTTQLTDIKGKSIVEGAKVYARWKNGSKYFEGTIVSLDLEKRTAHVHYADGDVDRAVPSTHIMVPLSPTEHLEELGVVKKKAFHQIPRLDKPDTFYSLAEAWELANAKTRKVMKEWLRTIPDCPYPKELSEFNYKYNDKGRLVNISTGEGFHWAGQRAYDSLGDLTINEIQSRMVAMGMIELVFPPNPDQTVEKVLSKINSSTSTSAPSSSESPSESPSDSKEATPSSSDKPRIHRAFQVNVFMTKDALTSEKLLLLIQGSGAVRPGQWARALCINDTLDNGAIFKYLEKAKERGYGVIVFNPNGGLVEADLDKQMDYQESVRRRLDEAKKNTAVSETTSGNQQVSGEAKQPSSNDEGEVDMTNAALPPLSEGKRYFLAPDLTKEEQLKKKKNTKYVAIPGHANCEQHTCTIWKELGRKALAKDIAIVAHSAGGYSTMALLKNHYHKELAGRLRSVAFTDAVHDANDASREVLEFLNANAVNWVVAKAPLDTPEVPARHTRNSGCSRVSAGHDTHEYTSAYAIESVWKLIDSRASDNNGKVVYDIPRYQRNKKGQKDACGQT